MDSCAITEAYDRLAAELAAVKNELAITETYAQRQFAAGFASCRDGLIARIKDFQPDRPAATEQYAQHVCDHRCRGESGHHSWPSPAAKEPQ